MIWKCHSVQHKKEFVKHEVFRLVHSPCKEVMFVTSNFNSVRRTLFWLPFLEDKRSDDVEQMSEIIYYNKALVGYKR